jgi:hypothetical protein
MPGIRTTRSSPGAIATETWSNGGTVVGAGPVELAGASALSTDIR